MTTKARTVLARCAYTNIHTPLGAVLTGCDAKAALAEYDALRAAFDTLARLCPQSILDAAAAATKV